MRNNKEERLALREERRKRLKQDREKREVRYSKAKKEIKKEKDTNKNIVKKYTTMEVLVLMIACISLGLLIGIRITKMRTTNDNPYKDSIALEIYNDIQKNYYGLLLDSFEYKQIGGMIQGLNDSHSRYLEGNYAWEYKQELNGEFVGIGTEVQMSEEKDVIIMNVFHDSPAEKAGIQKGDILVKINGNDLIGLTLDEIVFKIKGKNTKKDVDITINRAGETVELTITKENIVTKSVNVEYINDDSIAVISISSFNTKTYDEFIEVIEEVKEKGIRNVALDVRDNNLGYISVASDIASLFLDKGTIIYKERNNDGEKDILVEHKKKYDFNIAVVINGYSAKASEILATALRDNAGAYIVGNTSQGDSTIQKMIELDNGNIVEYTIGRWLTSDGKSVGTSRIIPNYSVGEEMNYNERVIEAFNNNI